MARILFVWELGRGFGHLAPYLDLVTGLKKRGHVVIFAARDVGHTEQVFGRLGVPVMQAPIMMHTIANPYRVQYNMSHLIHNTGFGELISLFGLVKAWRHVYNAVQPDLALFDHSPTALLAAKAYDWKRIVSGSGFLIPPPGQPLPMMRYWQQYDQERLAREEGQLLANMNRVLEALKVPPLKSVSEIYEGDDQFHLGFKELDHYPQRPPVEYLGMFSPSNHGVAPEWPEGFERKVFAYLHPYKQLSALLQTLSEGKFASIVYAPEVPDAIKQKFRSDNLRFAKRPLDIARVAKECDFAITNGTFGTTAAFLLAGTPVLAIPTNLERVMVARRVIDMGGGIGVQPAKTDQLRPAIRALFTSEKIREAARAFSRKYGHLTQEWQTEQMLERIDRVLAQIPKRESAPAAGTAGAEPSSPETAVPSSALATSEPATPPSRKKKEKKKKGSSSKKGRSRRK